MLHFINKSEIYEVELIKFFIKNISKIYTHRISNHSTSIKLINYLWSSDVITKEWLLIQDRIEILFISCFLWIFLTVLFALMMGFQVFLVHSAKRSAFFVVTNWWCDAYVQEGHALFKAWAFSEIVSAEVGLVDRIAT